MSEVKIASEGRRLIDDAAGWLAGVARVRSDEDDWNDPRDYPVPAGGYPGAVRNEYDTKTRTWWLNGPVWHTGQAIHAVLVARRHSGDDELLTAALTMGEYVARNVTDEGLLLAYEGDNVTVNVQTMFETLPGLLDLGEATGDGRWIELARRAADFALAGFDACEGLIADHYHVGEERFVIDPDNVRPGRIALDDAALVQLARVTGERRYIDVFLAMAESALREEDPPGNWIVFPPWHRDTGRLHVRCSWWWGYPLLTAFDLSGDTRFRDAALRAAGWYLEQQNLDGGTYYAPLRDGRHSSFAVATSGAAVATIMWADLWGRTGDERYREAIGRALRWLFAARLGRANDDPNVRGALWETLNVPDGSTTPGYRIRDIAPIFAVRALDRVLADATLADGSVVALDNAMPW